MESTELKDRQLTTDDELHAGLELLLERATGRQLWLLFLDEDDRLMSPLMPMDDFPDDPAEIVVTDDLGPLPESRAIVYRTNAIRTMIGGARIVLVWERRGPRGLEVLDRRWATESARHATELGVPLRAQFLLHSKGMRQIHADDL